jgi:hypothetical protein
MKLTKKFRGELDMEMQIADYKFRVRELEKAKRYIERRNAIAVY